ncbi:LLM class flavin-dependent oxidoreductase [Rossellomorea vietnamensis]|uniref:LLM class flavin-dependent oxidoreductase n=1 Tax=Rossellomorea vietnamensis TaxID=218284 RepID=UPI001CCE604D|nr:LLM class flavin-dependent oxidoreductase [Rossellomorea vietnamensis]MCA0150697.1 LLM class flavin-dependent oxidoreductase [Rossellomorea vietnamensis]
MKLSVLDQSVIVRGGDAGTAFRNTVELAQITEELGYTRFWVAEHHNTNGLAGSAPQVLISHIASMTRSIRVGSGGVLLPQYSPYKIAEDFKVLETLFPHRIDLGIGRSPGGSYETRMALTDGLKKSMNEFPGQVEALQNYLHLSSEQSVKAYPDIPSPPLPWILGITHRGARVAAEKGTAFTFGHFINPVNGKRAMDYYQTHFQPSSSLARPLSNVCIFVVCAPTEEQAEEMALTQDLWLLAVEKGIDTEIPSVEEAKARVLTLEEKEKVKENRKRAIIGTPQQVKEELLMLSEVYQSDEFMIITNVSQFEDKIRSYELIAEAVL